MNAALSTTRGHSLSGVNRTWSGQVSRMSVNVSKTCMEHPISTELAIGSSSTFSNFGDKRTLLLKSVQVVDISVGGHS